MSKLHLALILGLSLGGAGAPAAAQDSDLWGTSGDWDISVDPTIGNGCYALASWNGGTVLRIGRNPEKDNFYFLIGNDKWTSLQPEGSYDIQIQFGNRPVWDVSANGFQFGPGETVYLHAQSTKMDFIREFQKALNMKIRYGGEEIDNLKLTGSSRAWSEVERCQAEVANRAPKLDDVATDDPFATGSSASTAGKSKSTSAKKPFGG